MIKILVGAREYPKLIFPKYLFGGRSKVEMVLSYGSEFF
jgi:hypothetical protein